MICPECKSGVHGQCETRGKAQAYPDCDCQHRIKQKTIVLPEKEAVDEQPVTVAGPAEPTVLFAD